MKISIKGLDLLKEFEGVVSYEYLCSAKKPTISKGIRTDLMSKDDLDKYTFLTESYRVTPIFLGIEIKPNIIGGMVRCITNENSDLLIIKTLERFEQAIDNIILQPLNQYEFDALVSCIYNIGISAFKRSSMVRQINNNMPPSGLLKWNKVGGKVNNGLSMRRRKEYNLYLKGLY